MKYGWKTITGTFLLAAGVAVGNLWPEMTWLVTILQTFGTILGGIGLRAAIAKGGSR